MTPIMVNKYIYVTNNIGKAYMSIIMALFMIFIEIIMHDHSYQVFSLYWYVSLFIFIAIFIYLYRNQVAINDKQYLEGMIEHHSMALLTSEEILKKTDDYDIAKLAKNIIQTQSDELNTMKNLLIK
jgi:Ca2+/Na+ antiporter